LRAAISPVRFSSVAPPGNEDEGTASGPIAIQRASKGKRVASDAIATRGSIIRWSWFGSSVGTTSQRSSWQALIARAISKKVHRALLSSR
jgi:hypothetical protein